MIGARRRCDRSCTARVWRSSGSALASGAERVAQHGQAFGDDPEVGPATALLPAEEPGVGEDGEVVAHGRLALADRCLEVAAARGAVGGTGKQGTGPYDMGAVGGKWAARVWPGRLWAVGDKRLFTQIGQCRVFGRHDARNGRGRKLNH